MQTAFGNRVTLQKSELPRTMLTPTYGAEAAKKAQAAFDKGRHGDVGYSACPELIKDASELLKLPRDRYGLPEGDDSDFYPWHMAIAFLAPHYIPSHQAMLDGVMRLQAE
jgi:hypothetical protein